jgi:hypothetical protein
MFFMVEEGQLVALKVMQPGRKFLPFKLNRSGSLGGLQIQIRRLLR